MTIGIYKLIFAETNKVYVGQSSNIEARYISHKSSFKLGSSPPKLQNAVNTYGIPSLEILLETSLEELNAAETEAISIYNAVENGFNSLSESGTPNIRGSTNGFARYTDDEYHLVLQLLITTSPTYTKRQISEMTGVSIYVIRHISALESHTWLKEKYPEEYKILENIKNNRPYYQGHDYPVIVSPEGIEYKVEHVTNFAKEHGLLQPKLTMLLRGKRNMHKGWTRAVQG